MFGNSLNAKGNANSMKGTMIKIEKGTMRNKSLMVRRSCLRSRRVNVEPWSVRPIKYLAVWISAQNNCK